jgi:hypothetical protein
MVISYGWLFQKFSSAGGCGDSSSVMDRESTATNYANFNLSAFS